MSHLVLKSFKITFNVKQIFFIACIFKWFSTISIEVESLKNRKVKFSRYYFSHLFNTVLIGFVNLVFFSFLCLYLLHFCLFSLSHSELRCQEKVVNGFGCVYSIFKEKLKRLYQYFPRFLKSKTLFDVQLIMSEPHWVKKGF